MTSRGQIRKMNPRERRVPYIPDKILKTPGEEARLMDKAPQSGWGKLRREP